MGERVGSSLPPRVEGPSKGEVEVCIEAKPGGTPRFFAVRFWGESRATHFEGSGELSRCLFPVRVDEASLLSYLRDMRVLRVDVLNKKNRVVARAKVPLHVFSRARERVLADKTVTALDAKQRDYCSLRVRVAVRMGSHSTILKALPVDDNPWAAAAAATADERSLSAILRRGEDLRARVVQSEHNNSPPPPEEEEEAVILDTEVVSRLQRRATALAAEANDVGELELLVAAEDQLVETVLRDEAPPPSPPPKEERFIVLRVSVASGLRVAHRWCLPGTPLSNPGADGRFSTVGGPTHEVWAKSGPRSNKVQIIEVWDRVLVGLCRLPPLSGGTGVLLDARCRLVDPRTSRTVGVLGAAVLEGTKPEIAAARNVLLHRRATVLQALARGRRARRVVEAAAAARRRRRRRRREPPPPIVERTLEVEEVPNVVEEAQQEAKQEPSEEDEAFVEPIVVVVEEAKRPPKREPSAFEEPSVVVVEEVAKRPPKRESSAFEKEEEPIVVVVEEVAKRPPKQEPSTFEEPSVVVVEEVARPPKQEPSAFEEEEEPIVIQEVKQEPSVFEEEPIMEVKLEPSVFEEEPIMEVKLDEVFEEEPSDTEEETRETLEQASFEKARMVEEVTREVSWSPEDATLGVLDECVVQMGGTCGELLRKLGLRGTGCLVTSAMGSMWWDAASAAFNSRVRHAGPIPFPLKFRATCEDAVVATGEISREAWGPSMRIGKDLWITASTPRLRVRIERVRGLFESSKDEIVVRARGEELFRSGAITGDATDVLDAVSPRDETAIDVVLVRDDVDVAAATVPLVTARTRGWWPLRADVSVLLDASRQTATVAVGVVAASGLRAPARPRPAVGWRFCVEWDSHRTPLAVGTREGGSTYAVRWPRETVVVAEKPLLRFGVLAVDDAGNAEPAGSAVVDLSSSTWSRRLSYRLADDFCRDRGTLTLAFGDDVLPVPSLVAAPEPPLLSPRVADDDLPMLIDDLEGLRARLRALDPPDDRDRELAALRAERDALEADRAALAARAYLDLLDATRRELRLDAELAAAASSAALQARRHRDALEADRRRRAEAREQELLLRRQEEEERRRERERLEEEEQQRKKREEEQQREEEEEQRKKREEEQQRQEEQRKKREEEEEEQRKKREEEEQRKKREKEVLLRDQQEEQHSRKKRSEEVRRREKTDLARAAATASARLPFATLPEKPPRTPPRHLSPDIAFATAETARIARIMRGALAR